MKASSASTTRFMPARKAGIERQHALRRLLVAAVAEGVEAGRRAAEIDDDEEEGGERIEAEMRADPGQAERQDARPAPRRPRAAGGRAASSSRTALRTPLAA